MANSPRKPPGNDEFRVAIICPLEVELSAMRYMLDEEYAEVSAPEHDSNRYVCGRLQGHNVVIGYLPQGSQGIGAAAVVATHMKRTFSQATLRLLVGIGGGVPSEQNDIRLGDVVVSMPDSIHGCIVQYDLGKENVTGFQRKGSSPPPPDEWRNCVVKMQSDHRVKQSRVSEFVDEMIQQYPKLEAYRRPTVGQDILYAPDNEHIAGQATCKNCDQARVVKRTPLVRSDPKIFYGLIASGNRVVKNALVRDKIAQDAGGALCFEMEAAGLMNDFGCLVVRGISDYADSHKNDTFHAYGAAAAAGCAKELLSYINVSTVSRHTDRNIHWTVARAVNPFFKGRTNLITEIVSEIRNALQDIDRLVQHRIVITGIGGQGKSEICLHVANQVRALFWAVFWVDVNTTTSAEAGFSTIAALLSLTRDSIDDVRMTLANLEHPWLLILDNADEVMFDYQRYLPTGCKGVVVITSRNHQCQQYATKNPMVLEGLDLATARDLLLTAAHIPDTQHEDFRSAADSVAIDLLQGHPLAILQAGAYISQGHCLISEYTDVFQRRRKRLLLFQPHQAQSKYRDVYTTFETSSDALQASQKPAAEDALDLLSALSMCSVGNIKLVYFRLAWEEAQKILSNTSPADRNETEKLTAWHVSKLLPLLDINEDDGEWDPFRLVEAVSLLKAYALIVVSGTGDARDISMHPLIHAWSRDRQNQKKQQESWLRTTLMLTMSGSALQQLDRTLQLRSHFQALLSAKEQVMQGGGPKAMIARLHLKLGSLLQYTRLDKELFSFLQLLTKWLGLEDKSVGEEWLPIHYLIGQNLLDLEMNEAAIKQFEQICTIEERILPENHPDRLSSLDELASAYLANGQAQDAVTIFEKVVEIQEQSLAADHPARLRSEHGLARAYLKSGRVQASILLFQRLVWIREQILSEDHPNRLASQYGLARAYVTCGLMQEAIALLEKIVEIRETSLPEDHPERILSQNELSLAYINSGQAQKAVPLLKKLVDIKQRILPVDDPGQASPQHHLAQAYLESGQMQKAVELFEMVVEFRDRYLPEDDSERLTSQFELARAYLTIGRGQEAIALFKKVSEVEEQSLGEFHPNRQLTQYTLAIAYWKIGEAETAHALMSYVVDVHRQRLHDNYPHGQQAEFWLAGMEAGMLHLQNLSIA